MKTFEAEGKLIKIDEDERNVFGIFNMSTLKDQLVLDGQDEVIPTSELERTAYKFVLNARIAGRRHQKDKEGNVIEVGKLIESMIFTKEKVEILEKVLKESGADATISLDAEFWFGGFHIEDDDVWKDIKSGKFKSFSIGGTATRQTLELSEKDNA